MDTGTNATRRIAPIRAGIVGAGLMGGWHAFAIKKAGGRVLAVADPDLDSARRLASQNATARCFTSIEAMLGNMTLDVLHICTPSSTHLKIAVLAIDAGIDVLVEKPLTPRAPDTKALLDRAAAKGVLLCPVHQFPFQDGVVRAKRTLARIGRIVHMQGTFFSAGGVGSSSEGLDEIVWDILPHPLSLMYVFLPTPSLPDDWATVKSSRGELRAMSEKSGVTLSICVSMNARPPVCALDIAGTDGTLHLDLFHGYSFVEPGKASRRHKIMRPFALGLRRLGAASMNLGRRAIWGEPAYPGLQRLVTLFYEAVRNGSEPTISTNATMEIANVRESLMSGRLPGNESKWSQVS